MTEVLEATMLVCFGFSWPMNLIKNIKAKTARSMSLNFILLIIFGYLAGISAKIIMHKWNYVLIVYFINLFIVSLNLIVYFVNKGYDKKGVAQKASAVAKEQEEAMVATRELTDIEKKYAQLNSLCKADGAVFFGSNYFSTLPFGELTSIFNLQEEVYNRSVAGKSISELGKMLGTCVVDLAPSKVFVNIGDFDIQADSFDYDDFIAKYEWILYSINSQTDAQIYTVSILSSNPKAARVNSKIKELSEDYGCRFIDISQTIGLPNQDLKAFNLMKVFIRSKQIDFEGAMNIVEV